MTSEERSILMIISGPAGSGKTTLCDRMCDTYSNLERVITTTTRAPREGEEEGVDYYFMSKEEFEERIERNEFYEYAKVHSGYYGSLKSVINDKLESGRDLLLNIDVQGAATFNKTAESDPMLKDKLLSVFINAPLEKLRERLESRGKDDSAEIERRLKTAIEEIKKADGFNHVLDSGSRDEDFAFLQKIFEEEKAKSNSPNA